MDKTEESKYLGQMFDALVETGVKISKGEEPLPPGPIGLVFVDAASVYASKQS